MVTRLKTVKQAEKTCAIYDPLYSDHSGDGEVVVKLSSMESFAKYVLYNYS